jgi:O-antigen/teichoic acid export membrane protein
MEIGKTSSIGSFHLFVGKVVSTVILAVGTIILTTLILEADYGLYAVALVPTSTLLLFQDW